jgi:hypothetical protein
MPIQNILPDPNNVISTAGVDISGTAGPGFASVKLSSDQPIMRDRTRSGRLVSRAVSYHQWNIDISYNPMTKAQFNPIYGFLLEKQGSLKPFFVELPQYRGQAVSSKTASSGVAGSNTLTVNNITDIETGMMFTINDLADSTHTKAYIITRASSTTITFTPGLQKAVNNGATVNFTNPKIRVIQSGDVQEYSLNTNNLYSFSLKLEEACS